MPDYQSLHVKRNPETGAVAIRTVFPEAGTMAQHAWLVATPDAGAVTKITADVDGWDDLYTPGA
jgi:hypothetical protein